MSYSKLNTSINEIGIDKLFRCNYRTTTYKNNIVNIRKQYDSTIRLKSIFSIISGYAFSSKDYVEEGIPIVRIGDLNHYSLNYDNMIKVPQEYYEEEKYRKYIVKRGDILISLTGDGNLKCLYYSDNKVLFLNQRVAILRAKSDVNIEFYYWMLKSDFVKKQFAYYSNGKSQLNISPFDLANIKIPVIDEQSHRLCMERISPIIEKVNELTSKVENTNKLINDTFLKNLDYNYDTFNELKSVKVVSREFIDFGNNIDLRFSSKFHREAGRFIYKELKIKKYRNFKDIVKIPMITGQGISPKEYDENGEYGYISMADIKTWYIDEENLKKVSNNYSEKHKFKKIKGFDDIQPTTIKKGDILLMRSGEGGIGKTAIVTKNLTAIFCDFIIRISIDESIYNPFFVYYFTRTEYFQYLVEINKKGLGNNTNIFPNILNYFPIPDISLEEQQKIVDEVNEKINQQKEIEIQILKEQSEIEKILLEMIK